MKLKYTFRKKKSQNPRGALPPLVKEWLRPYLSSFSKKKKLSIVEDICTKLNNILRVKERYTYFYHEAPFCVNKINYKCIFRGVNV